MNEDEELDRLWGNLAKVLSEVFAENHKLSENAVITDAIIELSEHRNGGSGKTEFPQPKQT